MSALRQNALGVTSALLATVLWAAGSILTKHLLRLFDPFDLIVDELTVSTALLIVIVCVRGWPIRSIRTLLRLASPGLLQPGLAYTLAFIGLQQTAVSVETLLWSTEGVLMLPFAFFFLKESISLPTLCLGGLALAGVLISTLPAAFQEQGKTPALLGDLLILAAVLAACAYTIFAQKDLARNEPSTLLALHQLAGLVLAILLDALQSRAQIQPLLTHPFSAFAEVGIAGICLFAAPFWLYLQSMQILGSAKSAQFLPLVPVLTMLSASRVLGERISLVQAVGSAITIAAAITLSLAEARSAKTRQPPLISHSG